MNRKHIYLLAVGITLLFSYSCKDNFPKDLLAFSLDMNFTTTEYTPIVGRSTVYNGNFNHGESSLPLSFRISSVRTFDGKEAPELLKLFPVSIWKSIYTGEEKSLEEIKQKRDTVMRPLWEIGEHSGNFTMWEASRSNILKVFPDSGYFFDVEVSSSGGRRYFKDLKLVPQMEEPVEFQSPSRLLILGDSTRTYMGQNDVDIWFNKVGEGSSISFKFLDPDLNFIPVTAFNTTKWDELLHGFNRKFSMDNSSVSYDVEYPIPLVPQIKTKYINSTGEALVEFSYERLTYGGNRQLNVLTFPFRIYEKGDWEVIVYFNKEAPLFSND